MSNGVYWLENSSNVKHKQAVKKFDQKNGVAVHANIQDHHINWEEAKVITVEQSFWMKRVQEAIRIRAQDTSMKLDWVVP